MPNFVWTAKDKSGKAVVREIAADTIEESKNILLSEGCTDLELKDDEIMAAAREGFTDRVKILGEEVKVTAEERLKHRGKPRATFVRVLFDSLNQDKGLYLLMALIIAYEAWRGHVTTAALLGLATLLWPAFRVWMALPGIYYARLNKAKDWHRWQEVLDLVAKLERIRRNHIIKLPETELIRSRAQAFAGLGRLPEALAEFQKAEGKPGMPSWLYQAHLAGLHDIVKQRDRALEYTVKALQEKPTPTLYLDLANRLLRYRKDALQGRKALLEAEKSTLTDIAKPFHLRCHGILAYLEQDFPAAKKALEASLEIMERTRDQPFRDGNISVARAYLACVLARLGETAASRKCLAQAREYLVATGETELLDECSRLAGG